MNQALRLGGILFDAWRAPRADLFDRVDVTLSATGDDFAALTSTMRLGRFVLLSRLGLFPQALRERWQVTVGAVEVERIASIPRGARFTLSTKIVGWDADWLYVEQRFSRNGDPCAVARMQVRVERRGVPITVAELLAEIGPWHASPRIPASFAGLFTRRLDVDELC
ncbi:MAG: thioesterase family protein [Polyangiales bacterium]